MPCTFNIRLNPEFKGENGWMDCLKAVATEITALNPVLESQGLPTIPVRPDATKVEDFLGGGNTPPTEDERPAYAGIVTVYIAEYDFIDHSLLPAVPTTFFWISGTPPQAGKFI